MRTLVAGVRPGAYRLSGNARDDGGRSVATGVYTWRSRRTVFA